MFGDWLFEAAIWTGQDSEGFPSRSGQHSSTTIISSTADLTRINESAPPVTTQLHRVKEYEAGRAEAFTALCTIFSSQECGESVIPTYLARFYHALLVGLQYDPHVSLTGGGCSWDYSRTSLVVLLHQLRLPNLYSLLYY